MSAWKLYDVDRLLQEAIAAAMEKIDVETGEVPEDWSSFLDACQYDRDKKCLDVARFIKSLDAEADAVKAEKAKLAQRQKSLENQAERIRQYLCTAVKEGEKLKDANTQIGWRSSTRAVVIDEKAIPEEYWQIERKLKTAEAKKILLDGEKVPGMELESHQNISIK